MGRMDFDGAARIDLLEELLGEVAAPRIAGQVVDVAELRVRRLPLLVVAVAPVLDAVTCAMPEPHPVVPHVDVAEVPGHGLGKEEYVAIAGAEVMVL